MKQVTIIVLLFIPAALAAQIRPFDNSKAILPWLYNPATDFAKDFQPYIGYDGRGNSSFTPQSVVAGVRVPVYHGRREKHKHHPSTVVGVQILNTSQDLVKMSTINANFAHEIRATKELRMALGLGAGIYNMRYNNDDLVYMDQQDPLLNNGGNFFNVHLNAGVSITIQEKLLINLAAPYLVRDGGANLDEIIVRVSYIAPLSPDARLITSANLDTYNHNMIMGGDVRMELKKMVSILAGADTNKYHAGVLLDVKSLSIGYTFGQNYANGLNQVASHQITVFSNIPLPE